MKQLKQWTFRMPEELMNWLRAEAARETIRRNDRISMNTLALEILTKAMMAKLKKGGDR